MGKQAIFPLEPSCNIPKNPYKTLQRLGFKFGELVAPWGEPLGQRVTLPDGWMFEEVCRPDRMWGVYDGQFRLRVYVREHPGAGIQIARCFYIHASATSDNHGVTATIWSHDTHGGLDTKLWETLPIHAASVKSAKHIATEVAGNILDTLYPDWRNFLAYWD